MKKYLIITAACILSFTSAFSHENSNKKADQIALYQIGDNQFRLIYPYKEESKISIKVLDETGKVVDRDKVNNKVGFLRRYDMSALKPGQYSLEIKDGEETFFKAFEIKNSSKVMAHSLGDNRVRLLVSKDLQIENIRILNDKKEVVYKERLDGIAGMARVYDLSNIDSDRFFFKVNGEEVLTIYTKQ